MRCKFFRKNYNKLATINLSHKAWYALPDEQEFIKNMVEHSYISQIICKLEINLIKMELSYFHEEALFTKPMFARISRGFHNT